MIMICVVVVMYWSQKFAAKHTQKWCECNLLSPQKIQRIIPAFFNFCFSSTSLFLVFVKVRIRYSFSS